MSAEFSDIVIRTMGIDDLAGVFRMGEQLFSLKKYPTLYRTWDEFEVTNFYNSDSDFCLVAEKNGELAAFALGTIIDKRNSPRKYGYLVWFGVKEKFQRSGTGAYLFQVFKEKISENGATMMLVDTSADNHGALGFFEQQGFSSPRDHVYMSLPL